MVQPHSHSHLLGLSVDSQNAIITIDIPSVDYTAILNTDVSARLFYSFSGVLYNGTYTIQALVNSHKGPLSDAVADIANSQDALLRADLEAQIATIRGDLSGEEASLSAVDAKTSPYRTNHTLDIDQGAFFLDSSGVDAFPSSLAAMTPVNPANPVFTVAGTDVFIAVLTDGSDHVLVNITATTQVMLTVQEARHKP